jgi:hypothetical protein
MNQGDGRDGDPSDETPRANTPVDGKPSAPHGIVPDLDVVCHQYDEAVHAYISLARRARKTRRVLKIVGLDIGLPARVAFAANAELTHRYIKILTTADFQIG